MFYFRLTSHDVAPQFGSNSDGYGFLIQGLEIVKQGKEILDTIRKYFGGRGSLATCEDVEIDISDNIGINCSQKENLMFVILILIVILICKMMFVKLLCRK